MCYSMNYRGEDLPGVAGSPCSFSPTEGDRAVSAHTAEHANYYSDAPRCPGGTRRRPPEV